MLVRYAKYGELPRVNELRKMVNDLHVKGRPDIFRAGFCKELADHIYTCFESENDDIIVALSENVICGFAIVKYVDKPESPYNTARKDYHVSEFGVDEAYRRKGVARALVDFCREEAVKKGYHRIELDVWDFNKDAMEFYDAAGFSEYRHYLEMMV